MISTSSIVMTPKGSFLAQWDEDEDALVQYVGDGEAIDYFREYLALEMVSGTNGLRLSADYIEPAELEGFCQSEKYGISVMPDTPTLPEEEDEGATMQVLDAVTTDERMALIASGHDIAARLAARDDQPTFFADAKALIAIISELSQPAAAMVTLVSKRRVKGDIMEGTHTELTLSNGKVVRIQRMDSVGSMGSPGWHDMDDNSLHTYRGDTEPLAIDEVLARENKGKTAPVAEPVPAIAENKEPEVKPVTNPDAALLQSVIDGTADMMSEDLATQIEAVYGRIGDDPAMTELFNKAATAYSDFMIKAAKAALG